MADPKALTAARRASLGQYWHERGPFGVLARATLRTSQFVSALITLGIYSASLSHLLSLPSFTPTNHIYALVVSVLSLLTCVLHCFLTIKYATWVVWDLMLCVLWAAAAGTFGTVYLSDGGVEGEAARGEMKAAVAFDLIGMVLWLATFLQGSIWCCRARRFTRRVGPGDAETGAMTDGAGNASELGMRNAR